MKPACKNDLACYDLGMETDKPVGRKIGYVLCGWLLLSKTFLM